MYFVVHYERTLITANREDKNSGEATIKFDHKPKREDFPAIQRMLEERFLNECKGRSKNLLNVSFKIKSVFEEA